MLDLISLIVETRGETAKGSAKGRSHMLKMNAMKKDDPIGHDIAWKSKLPQYESIMTALEVLTYGDIFTTPNSNRPYVVTMQSHGGTSKEQAIGKKIAKANFKNVSDAIEFARRTRKKYRAQRQRDTEAKQERAERSDRESA